MVEPVERNGGQVLSILLLEDSAFDMELLAAAVEAHVRPSRITWVQGEADFTQALQTKHFDLILSDFELPGFNGIEALALARAQVPATPFIFVSGVIGEEKVVDLLKGGATDYVMKGRLERLPVVIERALREVDQREARQWAQAKLREADALYARVVDSVQDYAIILLDPLGRIRDWNQAASTLFGHARPEALGNAADLLFTRQDQEAGTLKHDMAAAVASGISRTERWLVRKGGETLRAESVLTPIHDDAGRHTGYSKIVRDVSAAYRSSQQLRQAKEEAERSNELKDQFLAVLSHELRAPLSAITGWADVLERRGAADPLIAKAATVIRRNAQLQAHMVNDLLDMSAVLAGKLHMESERLDLAALTAEAVLSQVHAASAKGIELQCPPQAPLWIMGDAKRLTQVISNLIGNALKFSNAGQRIEVTAMPGPGLATLRVQDFGCGISPEFLPHVFDRLRQEDGSITRKTGGLGLGLAIARAIVEFHQGTITVHSAGANQGATFEVRLPLVSAPGAVDGQAAASPLAFDDADLRGVSVLLVDDEADAREVGEAALSSMGADVTVAASAKEALNKLSQAEFDVLVSDISMPEMDGLSLIRQVRNRTDARTLPAVALTALAMAQDRHAGFNAGFNAYISKPIDFSDLGQAIQKAILGSKTASR